MDYRALGRLAGQQTALFDGRLRGFSGQGQNPPSRIAGAWVAVLGPVQVEVGGRRLRFGPQQLVLFTALVLAAGSVVPSWRLVELLWDSPPAGARTTLRAHIFNLRQMLRKDPVGSAPVQLVSGGSGLAAGYGLELASGCLDAGVFEQRYRMGRDALSRHDPVQAVRLLREALSLWRGQPLADVADRPFALQEATRLAELRRIAGVLEIEASLALGQHDLVLADLAAAVARQPDDQQIRGLLVTALSRCGRSDDAAAACRHGLELASASGLDSHGLRQLQTTILRGEPV